MKIRIRIQHQVKRYSMRHQGDSPNAIYIGREEREEILAGDGTGQGKEEAMQLFMNSKFHGMDSYVVDRDTHLFITRNKQ